MYMVSHWSDGGTLLILGVAGLLCSSLRCWQSSCPASLYLSHFTTSSLFLSSCYGCSFALFSLCVPMWLLHYCCVEAVVLLLLRWTKPSLQHGPPHYTHTHTHTHGHADTHAFSLPKLSRLYITEKRGETLTSPIPIYIFYCFLFYGNVFLRK